MPAPSARRLSPPPTPPWHRLLGPATRQAQLVHRGPGLSATRRVVLASCHSPSFPHPEAGHHIPASPPGKQQCPRNPLRWCETRCASGLLWTPRPEAHTIHCPEPQRVSHGTARPRPPSFCPGAAVAAPTCPPSPSIPITRPPRAAVHLTLLESDLRGRTAQAPPGR